MLRTSARRGRPAAVATAAALRPRLDALAVLSRAFGGEAWEAPKGPPAPEDRIPVTILTGFLGAGKTVHPNAPPTTACQSKNPSDRLLLGVASQTLLNRILSADHGLKLAVIQVLFLF